jgi:hypothetical protein
MKDDAIRALVDERSLRCLVESYARAVDRLEPDLLMSLFTPDGVIEAEFQFSDARAPTLVKPVTPGGIRIAGHDQIRAIPAMMVQRFKGTLHCVLNQTTTIDGDAAQGETYTLAYHVYDADDGQTMTFDMAIRYQDRYVRSADGWKFTNRRLVVDWTRHTKVALPGVT